MIGGSCSGRGARRRWTVVGLAIACALVVAAGGGALPGTPASASGTPPSAHAAISWVINYCTNSSVDLRLWLDFNQSLKRYSTTDMDALATAAARVQITLAEADAEADNVPAMIATAKPTPGYITIASKALDRLALDYDAMQRAHPFGDRKQTEAAISGALTNLNTRIQDTFTALRTLSSSASAYILGDRNSGFTLYQQGVKQLSDALQGLVKAGVDINQALTQLRTECPAAAASAPPMSPAQINSASGGGGSQRASATGFSVLASKRIKLNHAGRSTVPLTLTIPTRGTVEISLSRGNALIVGVSVSMGAGHGAAGMLINLPRNTAAGKVQLTATFTPGNSLTSVGVRLPIQLM
jgi:hypothetical protein